jgi:hypothetical protein
MRDDRAQALGPFAGNPLADPALNLAAKGSMLKHDKLIEFIQRNYEADAKGQWFFQNGPQRVYVELESTPFIWRLSALGAALVVEAHTGKLANPLASFIDEHGRLYLNTDIGFGLVHTQDMLAAAEVVEQGNWAPEEVPASDLPRRFGYVTSPEALQKK